MFDDIDLNIGEVLPATNIDTGKVYPTTTVIPTYICTLVTRCCPIKS